MKTIASSDLKLIFAKHAQWLAGDAQGERANLRSADLTSADLRSANLRSANLRSANLTYADLTSADLRSADLTSANLRSANLRSADLRSADLTSANLRSANLRYADLTSADLTSADLTSADLTSANLRSAVLSDGVRWDEYLSQVVPALLTAGGKALAEVATEEVWACHSWNNCPMAVAFGVHSTSDVPALYRGQAERFVQLFDAKLIPLPALPTPGHEPR